MSADAEAIVMAALERLIKNNWEHKHHQGCIHNLPPEEQIAMRGRTVEWWMTVIGPMPVQITPDDWEEEPLFPAAPGGESNG